MKKLIIFLGLLVIVLAPMKSVFAVVADPPGASGDECEGYDCGLKFDSDELEDPNTKTSDDGNEITIDEFEYKEKEDQDDEDEIIEFNWTSTAGVSKVSVFGGNNYNNYIYETPQFSGTALTPTRTHQQGYEVHYGLSHVTFCWWREIDNGNGDDDKGDNGNDEDKGDNGENGVKDNVEAPKTAVVMASYDPSPDIPAGGTGPSIGILLIPVSLGISGLGVAWHLLKDKFLKK